MIRRWSNCQLWKDGPTSRCNIDSQTIPILCPIQASVQLVPFLVNCPSITKSQYGKYTFLKISNWFLFYLSNWDFLYSLGLEISRFYKSMQLSIAQTRLWMIMDRHANKFIHERDLDCIKKFTTKLKVFTTFKRFRIIKWRTKWTLWKVKGFFKG